MTLSLNSVLAINLKADYESNVIVKELDNPVDFILTIEGAPTQGDYNLYTLSDVRITPSEIFHINSDPFVKNFTITKTESLDVDGYYTFTYTLNHRDVEKIDSKFTVNVVSLADILEVYSDQIDPSSGKISFFVKNKENVRI